MSIASVLKVGGKPDNLGQSVNVETRVVEPQSFTDETCRLNLPRSGILDNNAYITISLTAVDASRNLPLFAGITGCIETATLMYENNVIGIGSGQQNRVDCVRIAGNKAKLWFEKKGLNIKEVNNIVLVSDAFFPFADNIDVAAEYNTQYILQPGGSIRDYDIISACEKYNMKIVMSNQRVFTH